MIQIIGRAARNAKGKAILYADKVTPAMQRAMDESNRRREKQIAYNAEHQVKPQSSRRTIDPIVVTGEALNDPTMCATLEELCQRITASERELLRACGDGDKAEVEALRQTLDGLYRQYIFM
nr:hypothetical protein [Enterovibrio nigricans]